MLLGIWNKISSLAHWSEWFLIPCCSWPVYTTFNDIQYYRDNIHCYDMVLYYRNNSLIRQSPALVCVRACAHVHMCTVHICDVAKWFEHWHVDQEVSSSILSSCCLCVFFWVSNFIHNAPIKGPDIGQGSKCQTVHIWLIYLKPGWVHTIIHEAYLVLHAHSSPKGHYSPTPSNLHQLRVPHTPCGLHVS